MIVTEAVADEVQLPALVTVNEYVPAARPLNVPVVPEPVEVVPPGEAVTVQVPEAGRPLKVTDPVGVAHVGCVTVPGTGAVGIVGTALIVIGKEARDEQPDVGAVTVISLIATEGSVPAPSSSFCHLIAIFRLVMLLQDAGNAAE